MNILCCFQVYKNHYQHLELKEISSLKKCIYMSIFHICTTLVLKKLFLISNNNNKVKD